MDFFSVAEHFGKNKTISIYPQFYVGKSKDLMCRGKAFYAIWNAKVGMWSTDPFDVCSIVDEALYSYKDGKTFPEEIKVSVQTMKNYDSNSWTQFLNYTSRMPDNAKTMDNKVTFADTPVKKTDYVTKRLPYSMHEGSHDAFDELVETLYSKKERMKFIWAIGSIIAGDSKDIQKFLVFYGSAGTGKSTILNIIQMLFEGYYTAFDAKALGTVSNSFSTEIFRDNPLIAIQHDGDLSKIEDNTKLNSIVSHEELIVNEKHKATYPMRINAMLFMGTNTPVKITDAKSGILRRLIDVVPTGNRLEFGKYRKLMDQIQFELGAIAQYCYDTYLQMGKNYYDSYRPFDMMYKTNVFYNFVEENYDQFAAEEYVSLKRAYTMFKAYCDETALEYKIPMYKFREELKDYFDEFCERKNLDGTYLRSVYIGFKKDKFRIEEGDRDEEVLSHDILVLESEESIFDKECYDCPAQYAVGQNETPNVKWKDVTTKLSDIDTRKVHYVKIPQNHIVIDFDLKNESGEKDKEMNLEAAAKWPLTYAEFSKGGSGVHLHYIYDGDVSKLKNLYSEGIEVKVFKGNSSLRRRLSYCNNVPIAHISSGLPLKEEKMVDVKAIKSEKKLREMIENNLQKKYLPGTKPSMDFIKKILDDAYASELHYDVSDMRPRILAFALGSTNHAGYCASLIQELKLRSKSDCVPGSDTGDDELIFFDVEVFPNLFLVNWKVQGEGRKVVRMINPTPTDIEELMKFKLVGFNCRRYDNHILYARYLGYSNEQLYELSKKIVSGDKHDEGARRCLFGEAFNISYTDVYDFSSKKQSLKKFEIELGIHHQELGLPWDQPVDESLWPKVAEYCDNDVIATEAVFNARKADWTARQILASVAEMTVNDTTNSLTTKIIFEGNRSPQAEFEYRFMGEDVKDYDICDLDVDHEFTRFDASNGKPIFPGYTFDSGRSEYRGEVVGEGGYVYSEPGMYFNVALLDIASMHPSSIVAENLFGRYYTERFNDILQTRIAIKHGEFDRARKMLGGKLAPYLNDESSAKDLAQALKIAINSVYGLTSARFENPFRDIRNIDNIVAKRGALFMVNLKHEVQARGYTVAHIKTDSIKIPNATPEIIEFVQAYGRLYGYNFEHEATYDRMCLVNDAVYIAKYQGGKHDGEWTATGAQFAQPYVFKTLFSREPITFEDLCETKTVTSAIYLDMNENLPEGEHDYHFVGKAGLFCPIQPGKGGGELLREKDGKYYAVGGTKGYRWLESELVESLNKQEDIDRSYYETFVDEAINDISAYGDFYMFADNMEARARDTPPWLPPCGDAKKSSCFECSGYLDGHCPNGYELKAYFKESL